MYLISIYFDKQTDEKLRNLIQKVAKATDNTFMLNHQVPPHITVAAVETKHEEKLIARVEQIASQLKIGELKWVSVGSFSSQVLYVQPVLNEYLHHLSVVLSQELGQIEETICSPYYQPFSWLPHCTIGKQLTKNQVVQAFQILQNDFTPMDGHIVRIGIAKTNPHRDIKVWELGGLL